MKTFLGLVGLFAFVLFVGIYLEVDARSLVWMVFSGLFGVGLVLLPMELLIAGGVLFLPRREGMKHAA